MTIQSNLDQATQVLQKVSQHLLPNFNLKNAVAVDDFFYAQKLVKLSLFDTILLIQLPCQVQTASPQKFSINIDYLLKTQILLEEKQNPQSKVLGFSLFISPHEKYQFFICQQQKIFGWIKQLVKRVTIANFSLHFCPKKAIGSGQFSEVYQVQRRRDRKRFAAKKLNKRMSYAQLNGEASVQNQIQILRRLKPHPNIVKLHSIYESQKSIFIVQQFINGLTIQNFLFQKSYKLQKKQIRTIIKGILKALMSLDELKIIHRDLKPGNVMIQKDGNPVLIDFGLSIKMTNLQQKFSVCGSPGFIAPQIITQDQKYKISEKSDIFSLGCIFYFLLTGRTVFEGENSDEIYQKNRQNKINWGDECFNNLTQDQLDLLKKMLEEDPQLRISAKQALSHSYLKQNSKSLNDYLKQSLSNSSQSKDFNLKLKNNKSKFEQLFNQAIQITFLDNEAIQQSNKENYVQNQKNKQKLHQNLLSRKQPQIGKGIFSIDNIFNFSKKLARHLSLNNS